MVPLTHDSPTTSTTRRPPEMFPMPIIPPGQERQFRDGLLGACLVALPIIIVLLALTWAVGAFE